MNSLKADESVFMALFKKQPFYDTSDCNSVIRFGCHNSKLQITVFSNPYCNPCAMMHKKIDELLLKTNNNISVQYPFIFWGKVKFNKQIFDSSLFGG